MAKPLINPELVEKTSAGPQIGGMKTQNNAVEDHAPATPVNPEYEPMEQAVESIAATKPTSNFQATIISKQPKTDDLFHDFPPIKRGGQLFQLSGIAPDPDNEGRMLTPSSCNIPVNDRILTKKGDLAGIKFSTGKVLNNEGKEVDKYEEIVFDRGYLQVSEFEPDLYRYLMLCNFNADNPNRNPKVRALFKVVDIGREKRAKMQQEEKIHNMVRDFMDQSAKYPSKVLAFARKIHVDSNQEFAAIKHDVIQKIKADAGLYAQFDTAETNLYGDVLLAEENSVIRYNPANCTYNWVLGTKTEVITSIPRNSSDHITFFVNWLMQDTNGWMDTILDTVRKYK